MSTAVESHAFLVTDIEQSTLLWELDPAAMRIVLSRHDAILQDIICRAGGVVFKHTGDGLWARFATGPAAVAAALEIQDALCVQTWKESVDLRVRIALHAGEADLRDGDYYGQTMNRAHRLMSLANGGQILATESVVGTQAEHVPVGIAVTTFGDVHLRDVFEPLRVYQLGRHEKLFASGASLTADLASETSAQELLPHTDRSSVGISSVGPATSESQAPVLRVHMLGRFDLTAGAAVLKGEQWERRKARQLLKCLLSRSNRRLSKDEVIELLWPDVTLKSPKGTLRGVVFALRRSLESIGVPNAADIVVVEYEGVALRRDVEIWIDAEVFETLCTAAGPTDDMLDEADRLYEGPYLPDDTDESWAYLQREHLHLLWRNLQLRLAESRVRRGEGASAVSGLNRVFNLDQTEELIAQALMNILMRQGNRPDAVRVYDMHATALKDGLGQEPSEPLQALRREIDLASDLHVTPRRPELAKVPSFRQGRVRPRTLPVPATSLIGRESDVQAVCDLLAHEHVRLVTLTGSGGSGKTRLALEVAFTLAESFPDGVYFVDLTMLNDPALVFPTITQTLKVQQPAGARDLDGLVSYLQDRAVLLVLDNFEHLLDTQGDQNVDAVVEISSLLAGCCDLKVLVTSRTPLELYGERRYEVPLLSLPERRRGLTFAEVTASPAVRLFEERARERRFDFTLVPENVAAVLTICQRLDGLPLAIELAAAHVDAYTPEEIAARLKARLDFLVQGPRDRPLRHRTLRNTIQWSYDLLNDDERAAFLRLSVFVGGWTAEAAESVLSADRSAQIPEHRVRDLLDSLSAKCLIRAFVDGQVRRFTMLPTIREYALQLLESTGHVQELGRAHADWCVQLVDAASLPGQLVFPTKYSSPAQRDILEHDLPNLRRGLRWLVSTGHHATALGLALSLFDLWYERGMCRQGYEDLAPVVAEPLPGHARGRALGLRFAGILARYSGRSFEASDYHRQALAAFQELNDRSGQALSSVALAQLAREAHEVAVADALLEGLQDLTQDVEALDQRSLSWIRHEQAQHLERIGDLEGARAMYEECLRIRRELDDTYGMVWAMIDLAAIAAMLGDAAGARSMLAVCPTLHEPNWPHPAVAASLEVAGAVATLEGRDEDALRLFGAAGALRESMGASPGRLQDRLRVWSGEARSRLGPRAAKLAMSAGRSLDINDAIVLAGGEWSRVEYDGAVVAS